VRLYVEGGGDSKAQRARCRRGFSEFVRKTGLSVGLLRIHASGGRQEAYESFKIACGTEDEGAPMLLVDAEGPVEAKSPWEHLKAQDRWSRPPGVGDDRCHLMVQCMEAWFLADRAALAAYFGSEFRDAALPQNPKVEEIPKADVLKGLDLATRKTSKGTYAKSKGRDGFGLLAAIDPVLVEVAAPVARRFLAALRAAGG
jgi:hypothetical protein